MSTTKNQPQPRAFKDANVIVTKALPAAAAANETDSINLQVNAAGVNQDRIDWRISIPATPSLANTKTITLTLKDSADDSSFDAVPGIAPIVLTGAGGVGAAALSRIVKLPPSTRRYLRLDAAVEADGGNNTAVSYTLSALF